MDERTKRRLTTLMETAFTKAPKSNIDNIKERLRKLSVYNTESRRYHELVTAREYQKELRRLFNLRIQAQDQYITILHMLIDGKLDQETDDKVTQVYERLENYVSELDDLHAEAINEITF